MVSRCFAWIHTRGLSLDSLVLLLRGRTRITPTSGTEAPLPAGAKRGHGVGGLPSENFRPPAGSAAASRPDAPRRQPRLRVDPLRPRPTPSRPAAGCPILDGDEIGGRTAQHKTPMIDVRTVRYPFHPWFGGIPRPKRALPEQISSSKTDPPPSNLL